MATAKPRYTVSVDNDLFQKIEDFRFERRFQTRSEATIELLRIGLESLEKEQQLQKNKPAAGKEAAVSSPFMEKMHDLAEYEMPTINQHDSDRGVCPIPPQTECPT